MSEWIRKQDDAKTLMRLIRETADTFDYDLFWAKDHDRKQLAAIAWMAETAIKRINESEELWEKQLEADKAAEGNEK